MDLIENLVRYTKYAQGDLESECSLKYEDIAIKDFDFLNIIYYFICR